LYEKIQTNKDKDIIWLSITQEDFEKTETTVDDTSGIINDLINIE
jgi:hypothetical protein